ncbi:MAG TPA: A24 family peptidase [Verrucomicrobiae bacterium]|nr:A24 family peptidase [Verrucomicrobiae bacterium]
MSLVFLAVLIVLAWVDLRERRIPFEPVVFFLTVGLFWHAFSGDAVNAVQGALIGLGIFGLQFWLSRGRWIGEGDVWLGMAMGAWLGWQGMLIAVYATYIGGGFIALVLLLCRVWKRGQQVPLVLFLALGGIAAVAVGWWS